jgi:S1-C subfamily serine protease
MASSAPSLRILVGISLISAANQAIVVGPINRQDANTTGATIAQREEPVCGWIGAQVREITPPFAASLGMVVPYGAIFERPEAGGLAAKAGIEADDVITEINGLPLMRSNDFATIIATKAPGTTVYLSTWRNGMFIRVALMLGSSKCSDEQAKQRDRVVARLF